MHVPSRAHTHTLYTVPSRTVIAVLTALNILPMLCGGAVMCCVLMDGIGTAAADQILPESDLGRTLPGTCSQMKARRRRRRKHLGSRSSLGGKVSGHLCSQSKTHTWTRRTKVNGRETFRDPLQASPPLRTSSWHDLTCT